MGSEYTDADWGADNWPESVINRLVPADELNLVDGQYNAISEEELDRLIELTKESGMPENKSLIVIREFEMAKIMLLLFKQYMLGNIGLELDSKDKLVFKEK